MQRTLITMKKPVIGTIALLVITFILMQSCSADYIFSIIPGWHTTLLPKMPITRITGFWLAAVVLIYFLFLKKETSNTTAYIYLCMTLPLLFCDVLLLFDEYEMLTVCIPLFCISIFPFITAQIIFITKFFFYTVKDSTK